MPLTGGGFRAMGWGSALAVCKPEDRVFPSKATEAFIHSLVHSFSKYSLGLFCTTYRFEFWGQSDE